MTNHWRQTNNRGTWRRYTLVALALLGAVVAGCGVEDEALNPAVGDGEIAGSSPAIYSWIQLPRTFRVAVVLYDFQDTGANQSGGNPSVNRLPLNTVRELMFSGTGNDAATGSVRRYFREVTDNWMTMRGAVFNWTTLPRSQRVWRKSLGKPCSGNVAPVSLASAYYCKDPVQPAPTGTNTWLVGPVSRFSACPAGSSSAAPYRPQGNDWCNENVILDANLVPTLRTAASSACGVTDTGQTLCGFNESSYDAVIYASPYAIQGVYTGGKTIFTEARVRGYTMQTFAHELGHLLGLSHSQTFVCGPTSARVTYAASGCSVANEYGDGSSLMSVSNQHHLNGYEKLAMGAIPGWDMQTATASGRFRLAPIESYTPGSKRVLRVATGDNYPGTNHSSYFYLDFRSPTLLDVTLANTPFVQGAAVHLAPDYRTTYTYNGSANTLCGASCAAAQMAYSAKLLDTTPWTPGSFSDAPLALGASFTLPKKKLTMQVVSRSASALDVDVTFTPQTGKLFYYQPASGRFRTYWHYGAGGVQYVSQGSGASKTWTHVVGTNDGSLLWYNKASGWGYTARIDDGGRYRSLGPVFIGAGYTHVVSAGRTGMLFYNINNRAFRTASLSAGALQLFGRGSGWSRWTSIAGSLNGGVVLYNSATGAVTTGKLDGSGGLHSLKAQPRAATGYTIVSAVREDGLLFYNGGTGAVRAAKLGDSGAVTWKQSGRPWNKGFNRYTQILGQTNGAAYLYRARDGFSFTVTVDSDYRIRWDGVVGGIGAQQILAAAGGV